MKCLNFLTPALIAFLITGCAFKDSAVDPSVIVTADPGYQVSVDWSKSPADRLGARLKAIRSLAFEPSQNFRVNDPITLPAELPATLLLGIEVPQGLITDQESLFVRSKVQIGENTVSLIGQVEALDPLDGKKQRLTVALSALDAAFLRSQSQTGLAQIDLYGHDTRIASFHFKLRTPPSQLETNTIELKAWKEESSKARLSMLSPNVSGKRLNLLQVLRLKNQEEVEVEVRLPRRPGARLYQPARAMNYRDTGCNGSGYAVDVSPREDSMADDVLLLPQNERLLVEATNSLANPKLQDSVTLVLKPGESKDIGVYAVGSGANTWMDQGPIGSATQQITVPSDCYEVCIAWEDTCPKCFMKYPEPDEFTVQGHFCSATETRRHSANITVGTARDGVVLSLPEEMRSWPIRFSDLDSSRDSESRPLTLLLNVYGVSWF